MTDLSRIFRGKNFMTPDVIGYYKGEVNDRVAYIELSEGENLDGGPLYGVCFRRADGSILEEDGPDRGLSDCFRSKKDAMDRINKHKGVPI